MRYVLLHVRIGLLSRDFIELHPVARILINSMVY